MRFSGSTHLQMCLSLETSTCIIRTGLPILVELIDLVNSVIISLSQMTLLRWLTFLLGSQTVIFTVLFWSYIFFLTLIFVLQGLSLYWKILVMLSQFPLTFHHIHNGMPRFIDCIAYDYSPADWGGVCYHLRDVLWGDILITQCCCNCKNGLDSNNTVSIDVKMDGSVFEEKSPFKMLGLTFSSKLDWRSYIISIAKTASKKIGT